MKLSKLKFVSLEAFRVDCSYKPLVTKCVSAGPCGLDWSRRRFR